MAKKPLILIVDHDAYLAGIYAKRIEMKRGAAKVAETIAAAEKFLSKEVPALLLIDIEIEGKKGFDFLKNFKQDPKMYGVPAVVITHLGDRNSVQDSLKAGADTYLIKGHFVPSEAAEKVMRLIKEAKN